MIYFWKNKLRNRKNVDTRVYCKDCRYLEQNDTRFRCLHPNNLTTEKIKSGDWYSGPDYSKVSKKHPSEINKHNDCEWFKKELDPIF